MPIKIEITHKTIFFTMGILALAWFLLQITEIILLLFVAFILMAALAPAIGKMEKLKIPRPVSILIIYLLFIFFIGLTGGAIIPQLISQTIRFWEELPVLFKKILPFLPLNFEFLSQQISPVGGNLLRVTFGIFSNAFTVMMLFVLTFYMLMERRNLEGTIRTFFGETKGEKIIRIIRIIEEKLGSWVRGQVLLMFIIGVAVYLGLTALKIEYALPLAITAGLFEIVPIVGSIFSSVPAILVAFLVSPVMALAVAALYFIINQTEGSLIVPVVMKKAVGLPPIITLIALMVGAKLAGVFGALLAVPVVVVLQVILSEISSEKK